MIDGFITDQGHGIIVVPSWVEGTPRKSAWVGVRLGGRARSDVTTLRCRRCGFLESFALDEPNTAQEAQTRSQAKLVLVIMLVVLAATIAIVGAVLVSR
jgi:hypothetical protein